MFFAVDSSFKSFTYQLKHGHVKNGAPQVGLLLDCLRCSAGQYLSDPCVWHMATCLRNNLGSSRCAWHCLTLMTGQVACCLHLGKFNEAKLCKCLLHAVRFQPWSRFLDIYSTLFLRQPSLWFSYRPKQVGQKSRLGSAFRSADSQMPRICWGWESVESSFQFYRLS